MDFNSVTIINREPVNIFSWWSDAVRTGLYKVAAAAAAVGFPDGASGKEPTVNAEDIGMRVQSLG